MTVAPRLDVAGRPILQGMVRGLLPLYVLELLSEAPAHGTGLAEAIAGRNGGAWTPSPGSLYPTLKRLEGDGLIEGRWERGAAAPRRVYRVTPAGTRARRRMRKDLLDELRLAKRVIDVHLKALGD